MSTRGDFVPLSDGTLAGLDAACTPIDFQAGACLFETGDAADDAFVLLDGRVTIFRIDSGRTVQTDTIDSPGSLFGWEPLVFQRPARVTTVVADCDGRALRIDVHAIEAEDAIGPEGRLSARYLRRAAQKALDAYGTGITAGVDGSDWFGLLDTLVGALLRTDNAARAWGSAAGLIGNAAGATRTVLYTVGDPNKPAVPAAAWTQDPEAGTAHECPLSAGETPWFWNQLTCRQDVVVTAPQDLPEDAGAERSLLSRHEGTSLITPLHDGSTLRGALWLDLGPSDALPADPDEHGLHCLTAVLAMDLARRQDRDHLGKLAHKDRLTGLTNGMLFEDRLHLALARARRASRCVALLYLDLDGFDPLNRKHGSRIGDRLLQEIAQRLSQCARESDTVGRIGDDEFAIMLEDIDGSEAALQAAQRVMNALNQPIHIEEKSFYVGVSVGIAMYPEHAVESASLVRAGADAMAKAKQLTGSAYAFFSPDKKDRSSYRMQIEAELREALAARALIAYYQPIVDIKTGRIQGAEALARWPREDGTVLGPSYFLPIAEATGMVIPLSRQILRQACRETVAWNGLFHTRLTAAVNVSTRWLVDPQFLDTVENTLRDTGLPAHCLTLELTEEILSRDLEASERALAGLKALGVKLALDDFGTGHSSLAFLERFTIDSIKIDRSFTSAIVTLDDDAPILRGTLALGRELGASAVVEGVETEVQAGFLRRHGGTLTQGYFFGKPMPSAEFERRLTEQFGARAAPRHAGDGRTRL